MQLLVALFTLQFNVSKPYFNRRLFNYERNRKKMSPDQITFNYDNLSFLVVVVTVVIIIVINIIIIA